MGQQNPPHKHCKADPSESDDDELDAPYNGHCDQTVEDPKCFNGAPNIIKEMEFKKRACWMGKWFAHHYSAWVSRFSMRELESYQPGGVGHAGQDEAVSPVPMLYHTFRCFQIPDDEWRSSSFSSPVQFHPVSKRVSLTSLEFRLGLRRFRYEIVSTLRTHAIRIFDITDIRTIDDRDASKQVEALHTQNAFLYAQGDSRPMERYLRSDCILRVGSLTRCTQQAQNCPLGPSCGSFGPSCTR